MSEDLTTPLEEDVEIDEQLQDEQVEEQLGTDTTTAVDEEVSDYDKAWEDVDTENPSDNLFGETNMDDEVNTNEDQPVDLVETPEADVATNGLMIKNPVLKYKGRDIPIDSEEEAINLMQKGFKLESEMSKIKPMKGFMSVIQDGNISVEDLTTFKDALSGNEGAKRSLASKLGLNSQEEASSSFFEDETSKDTEIDYKPEVKTEDPVANYFGDLTEQQPEVAGKVSQVYSDIDDAFKLEVYNPQVFPMFATSIANGEFDKIYPLAIKARLNNPGLTWLQAYQMAGQGQQGEEKAIVPPKSTQQPRAGSSKARTTGDSYDRAFEMDTQELEAKLFG